jgi:hypothetical protein
MIYDSFRGEDEITPDVVWADWHSLYNQWFSDIHNKIRERRSVYRLDWTPVDVDSSTAKRWRDYVIDPLPRNDIDFKADRLTMRPIQIRIPTQQLDIDTIDVLNSQGGFNGVQPGVDLMQLTQSLRDTARKIAQKRADSIEKFLNGTLYINETLRKEHLRQRWAMHMLVDGYASYICYYDETASDDEYSIILRALDPLDVVYTRGDQKLDKFIVGRQDTVFNLRREFGSTIFSGRANTDIIYVIDYWRREKVRKTNDLDGTTKYVPEVWHCTYLGASGISGDPYITGSGPIGHTNIPLGITPPDMVGWALKPAKTDYFEIPADCIEARVTPLTENKADMVSGDLDAAKEIWNSRNYFLTRMHRLAKIGSGSDLIVKGVQGDVLQHLGRGEGATVSLPQDSPVNVADAAAYMRPPPSDPNVQMHDLALNQMLQQTLIPVTSLGNRGGTVSGAQVDTLDQGAAVRLQTFVNSMNMLHTSWCRTAMMIASVFYKDPNQQLTVYGVDKNSSPFAVGVSAADINGDYTVFAECNPQTDIELLQTALTALKLTSPDPSQAILSKQTIRENYLNNSYNYEEEQRILREAEDFNENNIKVRSQQMIAQSQMQVLANLENMRVQAILTGAPVNPIITQIMMMLQEQLTKGLIADQFGNEGGNSSTSGLIIPQNGINMPTNEGASQAANQNGGAPSGPADNRTYGPNSPQAAGNQQQANAARQGLMMPNGAFR